MTTLLLAGCVLAGAGGIAAVSGLARLRRQRVTAGIAVMAAGVVLLAAADAVQGCWVPAAASAAGTAAGCAAWARMLRRMARGSAR